MDLCLRSLLLIPPSENLESAMVYRTNIGELIQISKVMGLYTEVGSLASLSIKIGRGDSCHRIMHIALKNILISLVAMKYPGLYL